MRAKRLPKLNLGKIFFKEIASYKSGFRHKFAKEPIPFEPSPKPVIEAEREISIFRILPFYLFACALVFAFFVRLFTLQVFEGTKNLQRSEGNRISFVKIQAPRGVIYDRNGKILVRNKPSFKLVKNGKSETIDKEQALVLEGQGLAKEEPQEGELGQLRLDLVREYPYGSPFSHLLGYISEISAKELQKPIYSTYTPGERIGRLGLEETYEGTLKGEMGRKLVEVNAQGELVAILGKEAESAGKNLVLSIDSDLQIKIDEELKRLFSKIGPRGAAVVAQNPKNGEILALLSHPYFDNNIFSGSLSYDLLDALNEDPGKPFLNRATLGVYPPGSIFKLVAALAGLESGKINKDSQFEDTGEIFLGPYRFPNWNFVCCGKKEGIFEVTRAIARSNDIFFYKVGEIVGEKVLGEWAQKLGLGKKTQVDLPEEAWGLIPSPEWKKKTKGEIWFPGNTLHMAIGQGDVLVTPLQMSVLTVFVANGGTFYRPYLVKRITGEAGQTLEEFNPKVISIPKIKSQNLDLVREGMKKTASESGTAWPFHDFKIQCGAKTGTAEVGVDNPHAWFVVFCPFDDPRISLTIIVEKAGEGSSISGPVARKVMDWYFGRD
jgi:penicillin-binding protein 2